MENNQKHYVPLTASEISTLWVTYQEVTVAICGIEFFLMHVEDEQIREVLVEVLTLLKKRKEKIIHILNKEDYPIPKGYTEQDVNLNAPRLFSDKLYLKYLLNMTKIDISAYGMALTNAVRSDIIEFYSDTLTEAQHLHIQTKEMLKEKGVFIRAPQIPKPKQTDFVKSDRFLAGWFGERRPLLGVEISSLVFNAERNALGQALIAGFSQVAETKEVRRYFERGRDISGKHLEVFSGILRENYLSDGALLMTPEVTNSTEAPFSDKLMMSLITSLIASGIGEYGISISISPRHDLGVHYTRLIAEIAKYSNDGANIMIENGWMEQPPMAADRKDLAK